MSHGHALAHHDHGALGRYWGRPDRDGCWRTAPVAIRPISAAAAISLAGRGNFMTEPGRQIHPGSLRHILPAGALRRWGKKCGQPARRDRCQQASFYGAGLNGAIAGGTLPMGATDIKVGLISPGAVPPGTLPAPAPPEAAAPVPALMRAPPRRWPVARQLSPGLMRCHWPSRRPTNRWTGRTIMGGATVRLLGHPAWLLWRPVLAPNAWMKNRGQCWRNHSLAVHDGTCVPVQHRRQHRVEQRLMLSIDHADQGAAHHPGCRACRRQSPHRPLQGQGVHQYLRRSPGGALLQATGRI